MNLPEVAAGQIAGFADIVTDLKSLMPNLRGSLRANQMLADITWFRVGGPAQAFFSPADEADLSDFLAHLPAEVPVTVIGLGSNLLVRDGGIPGVVIRLGRGFGDVVREGDLGLRAGCAVPDVKLARAAAEAGIAGLAFYRGIPGSVGGALRMNGGAHGTETKDVLVSARAVDRQGRMHELSLADLDYTYRHCGASDDLIFTSALYQGTPGDPAEILKEMDAVAEYRAANQPINKPTGGSTFKNPPGHSAWKLVDAAGLRGFMVGPAQVSDMHCNFLINTGGATGHHLELLGETVRGKVRAHSGITLEWEIKRLGVPAPGQDPVPEFAGIPA